MLAELRKLWPSLRTPDLQPLLRYEVLPAISNQYGEAAATLAADWYDAQRATLNVPGHFQAGLAPAPVEDKLRAISNWATEPIRKPEPASVEVTMLETVQQRAESAAQKLVADMHRETIKLSSVADPNAHGWGRFTEPGACDFCLMLSARGGVYTDASVRFGSHDHCHCLAGPVWNENREWVGEYKRATRSDRQRAAANKLARKWMKDHADELAAMRKEGPLPDRRSNP